MRLAVLLTAAASVLVPALAVQVPLSPGQHWKSKHQNQVIFGAEDPAEWNLDKLPDPNDTDHLVFETVHSLLQHWPNTRMRNGHNIVPGIVPKGTLLYHGTDGDRVLPVDPDWVATDPEHAHVFCVDRITWLSGRRCKLYSLAVTRPLKIIYFDGNSGANTLNDTMDTQDFLTWGGVAPDGHSERQRIKELCKWGVNFGLDGFVRMEMDFEIMLCDLTSGLDVVSVSTLTSRGYLVPGRPGFITFEVVEAGSWHNRLPGETRVQLDLAGLVSFYDTRLVPSLVATRAGQERWDHRVRGVSNQDLCAVKSRLQTILTRPSDPSSGIDWKTLIQVVVDRFAGRLELTRHFLDSSVADATRIVDLANKTQTQLRIMLTPYLLLSATPTGWSDNGDLDWTKPIYKHCATAYVHFTEAEAGSMTDSEKLLLQAVRGTTREICRVVTKMWAIGVHAGIDSSTTEAYPDDAKVIRIRNIWKEDLERLMGWLDWSVWVKCIPRCGPEEMCYLPTWPIGFPLPVGRRVPFPSESNEEYLERLSTFDPRTVVREILAEEMQKVIKPEPDEWIRPQPRCIRRVPHWES